MAIATREIQRKIRSIKNTFKMTKAMELVATAKMRKSVNKVVSSRPYSELAWEMVQNLSRRVDPQKHPLLAIRSSLHRIGVVLVTSNRGLCGAFNHATVEEILKFMTEQKQKFPNVEIEIFTLGQKGARAMVREGRSVVADFPKEDFIADFQDISSVSRFVMRRYLEKEIDRVVLVYMDYHSPLQQIPVVKSLLPLPSNSLQEPFEEDFIFEPSLDEVLDLFLEKLVEVQIYQAVLESNASEHAARMMAMRNASDAAEDFIEDLTFSYNQARQQTITAELSDISAGRAAVE